MKILSWDIGIYNCSYILVEVIPKSNETDSLEIIVNSSEQNTSGKFTINDWDIVNFLDNFNNQFVFIVKSAVNFFYV